MRARGRAGFRACIVGATLVLACGARTGLDFDIPAREVATEDGGRLDARTDADAGETVGCTDGRFTLHRASPTVMFVLDRSQSMRQELASGDSRWSVLINSLAATLPPVDDTMEIGALVYPTSTATAQSCVVPGAPDFLPAFGNVRPLVSLLRANGPRGSTPTADAVDRAAGALLGIRAATRARAMVLATDGEPTCNAALDGRTCNCVDGRCRAHPEGCLDDVRSAQRLASYREQGLPTYVIGIQDPSNDDLVEVLDALAVAGGRPRNGTRRYYAASSEAELSLALTTIRDQVSACTYLTTSVPSADGTITVSIDGAPIAEGAGWTWSNRANGEILFESTTCAATRADATLSVDVRCDVDDASSDAAIDR